MVYILCIDIYIYTKEIVCTAKVLWVLKFWEVRGRDFYFFQKNLEKKWIPPIFFYQEIWSLRVTPTVTEARGLKDLTWKNPWFYDKLRGGLTHLFWPPLPTPIGISQHWSHPIIHQLSNISKYALFRSNIQTVLKQYSNSF